MKKITLKENVSAIKKMSKKMPKSINEAINFNAPCEGEDEDLLVDDDAEDMPVDNAPEMGNEEMPVNNASEKAKKLIDDIRKMSLRAMAELADTPEDENYLMLKKVWAMTDRKPEQDKGPQMMK